MTKKKDTYNSFNNFFGIDNDSIPEYADKESYEMALNAVRQNGDKKGALFSEGSTKKIVPVDANVIGRVFVEARDWYVLLFDNSEIGYFSTESETYTRIGSLNALSNRTGSACGNGGTEVPGGCNFDFTGCGRVNLEYNFWNNCHELHIEFSHKCEYYTVNLDEMADPKRRAAMNCQDLRTFKCDCIPSGRAIGMEGGGAGLPNGKYSFVCRLIDKDGHRTNFFNISNEISIGSDKNKPGELSDQYIRFYVEGLNCRYGTMEVVVIKHVGGTVKPFIVEKIHYNTNGISYEYRGDNGREIPISIEEITVKKVNYLQGRELKLHDGRMFYFQIKNNKNLHVQKYANVVGVHLPVYRIPSTEAHKYAGLQPYEDYLPALVYQFCDGTESHAGPLGGGSTRLETRNGLEPRTNETDGSGRNDPGADRREPPPTTPGTGTGTPGGPGRPPGRGEGEEEEGEGEGSGTGEEGAPDTSVGGGTGVVNFDKNDHDKYTPYDQLDPHSQKHQNDGYHSDGCITQPTKDPAGSGCEPMGKSLLDGLEQAANDMPDDSEMGVGDCLDCGNPSLLDKFKTAVGRMFGGLFKGISISISRNRKNKNAAKDSGDKVKKFAQQIGDELKSEEVWDPRRIKTTFRNNKTFADGGPSFTHDKGGTMGEKVDNINMYFVGDVEPEWVETKTLYPLTKDCSGGFIYGALAGKPVRLMRVPSITYFKSNTVGAKNNRQMGIDETDGYVYMIGMRVTNVMIPPLSETGKPLCDQQPWKIVYIPRDPLNSRVTACGIVIDTFAGDHNGRSHAIMRNGVNGPENIDRYIQKGGDDHNHEGTDNTGANIYGIISPDLLLGKIPLVANKFQQIGVLYGDGWRHEQYAESTKDVGYTGQNIDQRGTRQTINLHSFRPVFREFDILGITKVPGDSTVSGARGIGMPILNISRESTVAMRLSGSLNIEKDTSFMADGLDHWGPVRYANAPVGYLINEMDRQYGSLVNARYADLGLYAKGNSMSAEGLVGDSHVGCFNIRRTAYISNLVGNKTFIPSPRHWSGIARFLGFGDVTQPPDSGDERDPKNHANRHPGVGIMDTTGEGRGSIYYPGVLKTLVYFFIQSRVNAYYRQRGDGEGEVHARNLGDLYLDSDVPKGTPWEKSWLNRMYIEIMRCSKMLNSLRPALRIFALIGIPLLAGFYVFHIEGNLDAMLTLLLRVLIVLAIWVAAILIFTPSRINQMFGITEHLNDNQGGADRANFRQYEDNYMKYNSVYNKGSSLAPSIGISDPFNVCDCADCSEAKYYRPGGVPTNGVNNLIYYSARQYENTEINAFRNVLDGDYGEMQTNSSQIQALKSVDNTLWAITTDRPYRLSYDGDPQSNGLDYLLGNGRALGTPLGVDEGIREGSFGTIDPNAIEITPAGMFYIDAKSNSLILFNGGQFDIISNMGCSTLFQNNLGFCNQVKCRDQGNKGVWYTLGYDPELKRLLVTKRDGGAGGSWTMSYSIEAKKWISAHSYLPDMYLWSRKKLYSLKDNVIWRHNEKDSKQTFYGKHKPFAVWFHSNNLEPLGSYLAPTKYAHIELHTVARDLKSGALKNYTFNKGAWGTSYQMTGTHLLDSKHYRCEGFKDIRDRKFVMNIERPNPGLWRINGFKDNILNDHNPILSEEDCGFMKWFNDSNASCEIGDGKRSDLGDYYIRHQLVFDDPGLANIELSLLRVLVAGYKQEE